MAKLYNLARENTATEGTATLVLTGAVVPMLTFEVAGVSDGEEISYGIYDGTAVEVGRGLYNTAGTTLTRGTILNGTEGVGTAINLSGTAEVYIPVLAEDLTFYEAYMKCSDTKATTVDGGTFTQGAWQTRVINTEDSDTGSNMSLSSNQITLDAGTYRCIIVCPGFDCDRHQTQLYNISDTAVELIGTCAHNTAAESNFSSSFISGRFTIAVEKIFEVQHQCQTTKSDLGFGVPSDFGGNEVYTIAEFWKERT